jgi:hypothetical protein
MKPDLKKLWPHLVAVGIFLLVSLLYCKPALEGKVLNAHDNQGWKGMAQQSFEYKEKYGRFPLWTNSMFSGMPAYQIAMDQDYPVSNQWLTYFFTLGLPKPVNFFFLACLCFYLLALALGIQPWLAVLGGLSYGYSTYNPIIIGAGHDTKMLAIGYAPLVIAGILLLFKKRWGWGIAALAAGFSLQVSTAHFQIVYYTLLTAGFLSIGYLIESIREKNLVGYFKSAGLALLIGIIAFGSNAISVLTTQEYSKESMRGGISELKDVKDKKTTVGGLDKDYAFKYSVGIAETFTLFIPGIYGGSNGGDEYKQSNFVDKLTEKGFPEENGLQYANGMSYWGNQQPTSGPVYFGAVIMLLTILSLFTEKGWLKWSLLAAGIFGILLAWGKNLEGFNYFLFEYLPYYKKFRAPSMALVIPQLCFIALAVSGTQNFLFNIQDHHRLKLFFKKTALSAGGILLILSLLYLSFDYKSPNDSDIQEQMKNAILQQSQEQTPAPEMIKQAESFGKESVTALQDDRRSLFGSDLVRMLILIGLTLGALWYGMQAKNQIYAAVALLVLSGFDLLSVGRRYLNTENFIDSEEFQQTAFSMSEADREIKKDTGYYRVFNTATDPFNESGTSYYHNSVGGYHPAKLQIYQDLIENQISKNNMSVLNMLNTKYFIFQNRQTGQPAVQLNPGAFGPCWLVRSIRFVEDGKTEMKALDNTNLRDTAIVQNKFKSSISTLPVYDSLATLQLEWNKNDSIRYRFNSATPQFGVFSEVYFSAGWNAYIDGKQTPYVKTNYALRGLSIPAGSHLIDFRFEPPSYRLGNQVMLISTILLLLAFAGGIVLVFQKKAE